MVWMQSIVACPKAKDDEWALISPGNQCPFCNKVHVRVDRDGFIVPHLNYNDAGDDGVLLSVVAGLLGVMEPEAVDRAVYACITTEGLLLRRPDNSGPNQSHDGWMALSVWLLYTDSKKMARRLLVSGLIRLGYMKHTKFEFGDKTLWQKLEVLLAPWMGRFPKIWLTLIATAWPNRPVRWFCSRLIQTLQSFSSVKLDDASGTNLSAIDLYAVMLMGNPLPLRSFLAEIRSKGTSIHDVICPAMFDESTGIPEGYRKLERTHSLDRHAYTLSTELCAEIHKLVRERKMLIEALEFYAMARHDCTPIDPPVPEIEWDYGKRAREALKAIERKS